MYDYNNLEYKNNKELFVLVKYLKLYIFILLEKYRLSRNKFFNK